MDSFVVTDNDNTHRSAMKFEAKSLQLTLTKCTGRATLIISGITMPKEKGECVARRAMTENAVVFSSDNSRDEFEGETP